MSRDDAKINEKLVKALIHVSGVYNSGHYINSCFPSFIHALCAFLWS